MKSIRYLICCHAVLLLGIVTSQALDQGTRSTVSTTGLTTIYEKVGTMKNGRARVLEGLDKSLM
jgi:hypothetical protein